MSSLLQFNGRVTRQGVGLLFCLRVPTPGYTGVNDTGATWESDPEAMRRYLYDEQDAETEACWLCLGRHSVLYEAYRKPCGMLGCWVQFRYNGEIHAPDLSIPINTRRLPRDARRVESERASRYWHSS